MVTDIIFDKVTEIVSWAKGVFKNEQDQKECDALMEKFELANKELIENISKDLSPEHNSSIINYRQKAMDAKMVSDLDVIMFKLFVNDLIDEDHEKIYRSLPKLSELQKEMNDSVKFYNDELTEIDKIHEKAKKLQDKYNEKFTKEVAKYTEPEKEKQLNVLIERRAIDYYNAILNGKSTEEAEILVADAYDVKIETLSGKEDSEEEK